MYIYIYTEVLNNLITIVDITVDKIFFHHHQKQINIIQAFHNTLTIMHERGSNFFMDTKYLYLTNPDASILANFKILKYIALKIN